MSELTKAMYKVHKKLNNLKIKTDSTANTKTYNYKYLSYDGLLCIIRPILDECGLYLDQGTTVIDGKDVEHLKIVHGETGEATEAKCLINNMKDISKSIIVNADANTHYDNVKDMQTLISTLREDYRSWGAELSYKKRHLLLAKLGLHPDDDNSENDPEETISRPATPGRTANQPKPEANIPMPKHGQRCISQKQAGLFLYKTNSNLAFRKNITDKYGHVNNIPASEFSQVLQDLEDGAITQEQDTPKNLPF